MTDKGRNLFYVYDPQLLDKDGFNTQCTIEEQSIVLGCYDGSGIYLYDISDVRLEVLKKLLRLMKCFTPHTVGLSAKEKSGLTI